MLDKTKLRKKKKKNTGKVLLIYLSIIGVLSVTAYGYKQFRSSLQTELSQFELSDIYIKGNKILTEKEILKNLGLQTGQKLLEISPEEVVEKLKKSEYIRAVGAVYSLPSTLRINIQEREPVAFIYGRGMNLIDKENYIIPVPQKSIRWDLPVITGISEKLGIQGAETISPMAKTGVEITCFIKMLEMPLPEMVSEINFSNSHFIEIKLTESRASIRIDRKDYQEQLFIAAKYLKDYMDFEDLDDLDYVDVRFEGQIVIKKNKA